eukprot:14449707-Ditylum_brightwellii.AAC.1
MEIQFGDDNVIDFLVVSMPLLFLVARDNEEEEAARNGREGGAEEADILLKRMIEQYCVTCNESVQPDAVAFSAVIDGWSRSKRRGSAYHQGHTEEGRAE